MNELEDKSDNAGLAWYIYELVMKGFKDPLTHRIAQITLEYSKPGHGKYGQPGKS